jgi:hypothetical protein
MAQIIEVTVSPSGEVTLATRGFAGPACREATRQLEAALGKRLSEELTSEYHRAATARPVTTARHQEVGRR